MAGVKFTRDGARRIVDAVRRSERTSTRLIGPAPRQRPSFEGWYPFKNVGSEAIPMFGVMRVTTSLETVAGDKHNIILKCQKPDTTFSRLYAVNGSEEIQPNGYGLCRLPPFDNVEVLYDTANTPAFGEGWGPKPDSFKLFKNYPTTAIIIGELSDLSGAETVLCSWQAITEAYATANGSIAAGASGAISIHQGTLGSTTAISGMDPTFFNAGDDVESGEHLLVFPILGQMAFQALCPQP